MKRTTEDALKYKKQQLNKVLASYQPTNRAKYDAHIRRQENAKCFLKELDILTDFIPFSEKAENVLLVSRSTFQRKVEKADFAEVDFDGLYCKVAVIYNFPETCGVWLIYVASLEDALRFEL